MKHKEILAILVLALGYMVFPAKVSEAVPMGTAFTYQGHLYDANYVADGLYDFQFKLFDDPNVILGEQVGNDVNIPDLDIINGYFTVELDFGDVFDGNARWLEIVVRPGASVEVNDFTTLLPRQEVTPTPYAIYAQMAQEANTIDGLDSSDFADSFHVHPGEDITTGTVHTNRYSAYNDLGIEGYLGNAPGDLAKNNGVWQSTLNADMLDSQHESAFFRLAQSETVTGRPSLYGGTSGSTPPFYVDSTYKVTNLNADYLDGFHSSSFASSAHSHNTLYFTEAESDSRFVNVTGDTMTGALNMNTTGTSIDIVASPTAATTYGVRVNADQSAANNYTIYGLYSDTESSAATANVYGMYSNARKASGTGTVYGAYDYAYHNGTEGTAYGTYSYAYGSDTGSAYGVYSLAYKSSTDTSGTTYGGYFSSDNDSSGTSYGIYTNAY